MATAQSQWGGGTHDCRHVQTEARGASDRSEKRRAGASERHLEATKLDGEEAADKEEDEEAFGQW